MPANNRSRLPLVVALVAFFSSMLAAQTRVETDIFVADRGNNQNGSDGGVRRYSYTGQLIGTLSPAGSGAIRGIGLAANGDLYVTRGDAVLRYPAPFYSVGTAIHTDLRAQDVAVHPVTGNIWVGFGASASEAKIKELDVAGTVLQTITNAALVHPRSLAFSRTGGTLWVANGAGANVLAVNATTGAVQTHAGVASQMGVPIHLASSPVVDDRLFVVSDYGAANRVFQIDGAPGSGTVTTWLDYSSLTDLMAPSGVVADTYGNVWMTSRDITGSTPGVYCYVASTASRPILPYVGSEHVNPIDLAFLYRDLSMTVTSNNGTFGTNATPLVPFSALQTTLTVSISAPNYPGKPYGIFWCSYANTAFDGYCGSTRNGMPLGDGVQIDVGDARRAPIVLDAFFLSGVSILQHGGSDVVPALSPTLCPGSTPGFFFFMSGQLDASGQALAQVFFPSAPCPPPVSVTLEMAMCVAIVDTAITPSSVGLLSNVPACFALHQP